MIAEAPTHPNSITSAADAFVWSRLGQKLRGKYQLDHVLGVGGMAAVYAATHRNRKQFAVKVLHAELSSNDHLRRRFLREGYVANSVRHPGVVSVLDDDVTEDGSAFLVMELLDGKNLEQLWTEHGGSLPIQTALWVGAQLLDVLVTAHTRGVLHRDLKPANLLLTWDGTLKVLDFGIARLRDTCTDVFTTSSIPLGTPAFVAPEQALGNAAEVDARTDIWSVGATLFTLISGQLVHEGHSSRQLLISAATRPTRSLADVSSGAPRAVIELVDRALAFQKDARWRSAAAMHAALDRAHRETFGAPVPALANPRVVATL